MTRLLSTMSDRLLTMAVPRAEAAAACTPRCGVAQYRCASNGQYQKRTCCIDYYYCSYYNYRYRE